jgi:hypothetical protein
MIRHLKRTPPRLLHAVLGDGLECAGPPGNIHCLLSSPDHVLTHASCKMPKDIEPDVAEKDSGKGEGSLKADKPPSPKIVEETSEAVKPPSLRIAKDTLETVKSPSPRATEETPKKTKPPSPMANKEAAVSNQGDHSKVSPSPNCQMEGLGAAANAPTREGSTRPKVEEMPQPLPRVADPLTQDPYFIRVRCHLGKYITTAVNTEAKQAYIQALKSDLDSASL